MAAALEDVSRRLEEDQADYGRGAGRGHEYAVEQLIFPGTATAYPGQAAASRRDKARIGIATHGGTPVKIRRTTAGKWKAVLDSPLGHPVTTMIPGYPPFPFPSI